MALTLDTYRLLGRSGLRVSPLALGTATFGTEWGWGAEQDDARKLFDLYVERGGNFVDTAPTYTNGSSECLLGQFIHDHRDSLVVATKYTTLRRSGDPNSGGAHRKSLFASVEASCAPWPAVSPASCFPAESVSTRSAQAPSTREFWRP